MFFSQWKWKYKIPRLTMWFHFVHVGMAITKRNRMFWWKSRKTEMHCGWKYKHCAAAIKNRMAGSTLLAPPPAIPASIQRAIGGVSLRRPAAGARWGGARTFPDPIDSQVSLHCWLHPDSTPASHPSLHPEGHRRGEFASGPQQGPG